MRFRIGYGGPEEYRHGQYRPGGRRKNGGMTEIERLIHLIASMQILFGSRRGGAIIPLLVIGLGIGGWFMYRNYYSPERALERAHVMFESSDTDDRIKAIKEYKRLLDKSDPIEPSRHWLMTDRDTLFRRIILHEVKFAEDNDSAAEWVTKAWDDGHTDLRFQDDRVKEFWQETVADFRKKRSGRTKNEISPKKRKGRFKNVPGLDG